ncbi:hypothetical protein [Streptomyces fructofermentans]|uniref:Lipoprotein n=1 Tax=Streptomyces fructofermentans TaxID=152141 RepID=A0A918U5S9_9ACTN|nr:hypothetical protein [Streptomyces fructofermentans]GGX99058.1 hypothetical protein GCM10010515_76520 [Streptomyces fructofermentans]
MSRALLGLGALLTAAALALAACDTHKPGPAGRVVAKDTERECHWTGTGKTRRQSCTTDYELTTRDKDGTDHTFEVSSSDYDNCRRGSAYPKCTTR